MYAGPHSEHVNTFTIGGGPLTHMPDSPRSGNGLDCLPDATNSRSTGHLFVSVVVVQRVKHQLTGFQAVGTGRCTLWIIEHLFGHNELARGLLVVDGRQVNLSAVDCPIFLLAGIKTTSHRQRRSGHSPTWSRPQPGTYRASWSMAGTSVCSWAAPRWPSTGRRLPNACGRTLSVAPDRPGPPLNDIP